MSKKRWIIILLIFVILIGAAVGVNHYQKRTQVVTISSWKDLYVRNSMFEISGKEKVSGNSVDVYTFFRTQMTMGELIAQSDCYVGKYSYVDFGREYEVELFFKDNSSYSLTYIPESDGYRLQGMYGTVDMGDSKRWILVPLWTKCFIAWEDDPSLRMSEYKNLFEYTPFEQVCEFYKMYSEEYVRIDKENQLIYLTGNDIDTDKLIHEYMCLDFKNKTITFNNGKDEPYTIDGTIDEDGKYVVVQ